MVGKRSESQARMGETVLGYVEGRFQGALAHEAHEAPRTLWSDHDRFGALATDLAHQRVDAREAVYETQGLALAPQHIRAIEHLGFGPQAAATTGAHPVLELGMHVSEEFFSKEEVVGLLRAERIEA